MSLSLSVELERAESPAFRPGDVVRGHVAVTATEGGTCNGLSARLLWRTSGKGNKDEKVVQRIELFAGTWPAGTGASYPFELTLPGGPLSYDGTLVHVHWLVQAVADVPWAIDPKAEASITLLAWDADAVRERLDVGYRDTKLVLYDDFDAGAPLTTPSEMAHQQAAFTSCLLGCGGVFGVVGALALAMAMLDGPIRIGQLFVLLPIGVVLLAIGLWRRWTTRKLGGEPTVMIEPSEVQQGDSVRVTVRLALPEATELERAVAVLRGREQALKGSGSNSRLFKEPIFEDVVTLAQPGTLLDAGGAQELVAQFRVPADAPCSFEADANKVRWQVELDIDPKGAPAYKRELPLTVRPPTVARLRAAGR